MTTVKTFAIPPTTAAASLTSSSSSAATAILVAIILSTSHFAAYPIKFVNTNIVFDLFTSSSCSHLSGKGSLCVHWALLSQCPALLHGKIVTTAAVAAR